MWSRRMTMDSVLASLAAGIPGVFLLAWMQGADKRPGYLAYLGLAAAIFLLTCAIALPVRGGLSVTKLQNFCWGWGACTVVPFAVVIILGGAQVLPSWRPGWTWQDIGALVLSVVYLAAYADSLRLGGVPKPAETPPAERWVEGGVMHNVGDREARGGPGAPIPPPGPQPASRDEQAGEPADSGASG